MSEPAPRLPSALARLAKSLQRDLATKTFLNGLGDQLLKLGQAAVALAGLDAFFKPAAASFDPDRAIGLALAGCVTVVFALYLKARGERL